jgi:hypothetical protein
VLKHHFLQEGASEHQLRVCTVLPILMIGKCLIWVCLLTKYTTSHRQVVLNPSSRHSSIGVLVGVPCGDEVENCLSRIQVQDIPEMMAGAHLL